AIRCRHDRLVARTARILRWFEARAHLGLLAARVAHMPPPHTGANLAAPGRTTCPSHLRALRRCQVERGRSHLFAGGRDARGKQVTCRFLTGEADAGLIFFSRRRTNLCLEKSMNTAPLIALVWLGIAAPETEERWPAWDGKETVAEY